MGAVLVTGGTGFIGSYLVEYLIREGRDVRVLARNPSNLKWINHLRGVVEVVAGDVTDESVVREALRGVEEVYHLAAVFRHGVNPELIWRVNYLGTRNVADECLRVGARLLHVSTVGVLGPANTEPLSEDSPLNPNPNPYARSKARAEEYVLRKCREGLEAVVVRPAFVYGPRGTYGLNLLMYLVTSGRLKVVVGDGSNYIHPIHVRDLVKALVIVMGKGVTGEVYIAANEEPVKLREFIELTAKYSDVKVRFGLPPIIARALLTLKGGIGGSSVGETLMLFTRNWFYRVDKLMSLGWRQEVSIIDGVRETVDWLRRYSIN